MHATKSCKFKRLTLFFSFSPPDIDAFDKGWELVRKPSSLLFFFSFQQNVKDGSTFFAAAGYLKRKKAILLSRPIFRHLKTTYILKCKTNYYVIPICCEASSRKFYFDMKRCIPWAFKKGWMTTDATATA